MKKKFLKSSYNLMAALVLTILVAGPHATQAGTELAKGPDTEFMKPNGDTEIGLCV